MRAGGEQQEQQEQQQLLRVLEASAVASQPHSLIPADVLCAGAATELQMHTD
jgi:hypothetical protein